MHANLLPIARRPLSVMRVLRQSSLRQCNQHRRFGDDPRHRACCRALAAGGAAGAPSGILGGHNTTTTTLTKETKLLVCVIGGL